MKNDKYLKIILTIIAICLVWICVKDIKIGTSKVYAKDSSGTNVSEVYIVGADFRALMKAGPMSVTVTAPFEVTVTNWPNPQPAPQKEEK